MSILGFIKKVAVQTAVYWAAPQPDGYGGAVYTDIHEIKCRWDDKTELIVNEKGEEITSKAQLLLVEELGIGGWLWLGALDDLKLQYPNSWQKPESITNAYTIKSTQKTPLIRSKSKFVLKVYI